jgi:tetratricopeptide (TPR) repeat protein
MPGPDRVGELMMLARVFLAALVIACVASVACKRSERAAPAPAPEWRQAVPEGLPAAADIRGTTSPELAIADLEGRIDNALARLERAPQPTLAYAELIPLLLARARFLDRPDDYDRAVAAANAYVEARPGSPDAYLSRARVYSSVHRFADAARDIDQAHALGAPPSASREVRAALLHATGALDQALAVRRELVEIHPSVDSLGALAALYAELGQRELAADAFARALRAYRDVSPFTLAWLFFQWGRMYEQAGELTGARYLYHLARERLPQYHEVTGHLAGVLAATSEIEPAATMLRELVAISDNPEHLGQLAAIEERLGNADQARALRARASAGFDALLARFPEAFADHAARYYLGAGGDAARALALARENLEIRRTPAAFALAIEAALAASNLAEACALADAGSASSRPGKGLLFQAWRAYTACGQAGSADQLAERLGMNDSAAP